MAGAEPERFSLKLHVFTGRPDRAVKPGRRPKLEAPPALAVSFEERHPPGPGWLCDPKSRAAMLWSIAAQASTIDALVTVGTRARARADDLLGWTIDAQISARKRLEAAQSDGKDATPKPRRRPPKE